MIQLRIEQQALSKETDRASKERLKALEKELAELQEQSQGMKAQWQAEKEAIGRLREKKAQLEEARAAADKATREGDLQKAAEIRYGKIPGLEREIEAEKKRLEQLQTKAKYLKEEVDAEDVAEIVSKWTGIPVSKMLESERARLTRLEQELGKRVIGQNEALAAVANAVRRSRAGLQDPNRPIGSFIFLGPTGVGKTETARALAEFLFDDERAMVRLDMSEYMEKHAVARMIGAPPGYVGYEEGGQLTEAVRRRPYSVVLFDEIEKAHQDVFNVLLQILDDGRLTDSQGRTVSFRNTVIIMTSNLGSQWLLELGEREWDQAKRRVLDALRETFKPEFLNRVDDVIVFRPLSREDLAQIVDLQLAQLRRLLEERRVSLELSPEARDLLLAEGYDPVYGARPLKRVIQRRLQNPLALALLEGRFGEGDRVRATRSSDGDVAFEKSAGVKEPARAGA
jgi:ATP-dependent Clp protease ATP-binding subunit ClpB